MVDTERIHALDALRATALLLGVLLHSTLTYVLPDARWAVGTTHPVGFLTWLFGYLHAFRLEMFFLLAGFFGALVAARRGVHVYLCDRAKRILLVFIVAIYPMKFLLDALWLSGGRKVGWLGLPPGISSRSSMELAGWLLARESWHNFTLTHLWFLYYLAWIIIVFAGSHWMASAVVTSAAVRSAFDRSLHYVMQSRAFVLVLALAIMPTLAMGAVDHAELYTLAPKISTLSHYGLFFALGWYLQLRGDLLSILAQRCISLAFLGFAASLVVMALKYHHASAQLRTLQLLALIASGVTTAASVCGWLGCFVRYVNRPSPSLRYLADASYWIYVAHLPVVVALQVWWADWLLPWWIQVPLINAMTMALLLLIYRWAVRPTWLGAWLNGKRLPPSPVIPQGSGKQFPDCNRAQVPAYPNERRDALPTAALNEPMISKA